MTLHYISTPALSENKEHYYQMIKQFFTRIYDTIFVKFGSKKNNN